MQTVLYELGGDASEAAKRLHQLQYAINAQLPNIPYPVSLDKLIRFGRAVDAYAHDRARETMAADLAALALETPVIAVDHRDQQYPRAYRTWPSVYTSEMGDGIYYMYSPVAHDGTHFVPKDSRRIEGEEEQRIGEKLGGGGWLTPFPVMPQPRQGVALPDGYTPPATVPAVAEYVSAYRVFVAGGNAMRYLQAYQVDLDSWKRGMSDALEAAQGLVRTQANASVDAKKLKGDGLQFSSSYTMDDNRSIELTLQRDGQGRNIMTAGKPIDIPQSTEYQLERTAHGRGYKITPSSDPQTPEGRDFKAIYNSIPHFPKPSEYGDLGGPGGVVPNHVQRGGYELLMYSVPDNAPAFCPAGAAPMSRSLHDWIMRDEQDAMGGTTPPPMPQALRDEVLALPGKRPLIDRHRRLAITS